jgi:hypothetical protein
MAIGILGIFSIGDIVAKLELIATAFIFYIGYRRTRINDQLRLLLERQMRVDELNEELKLYVLTNIEVNEWDTLSKREQKIRTATRLARFHSIHLELEILTILKNEKDISSNLTDKIVDRVISVIVDMKKDYNKLKKDSVASKLLEGYHDDFQYLKEVWQSDKQSKLEAFFSRLK